MPDPSPEQITLTLNRADAEDINFEGFENASDGAAARFHESLDAALSLEGEDKCERCVWTGESPCPSCHGRGGRTESVTGHPVYGESLPGLVEATAAPSGARGADLEGDEPSETEAVARVKAVMKAGRDAGSGVFDSNSVFRFGTHGVAALLNFLERDGWEVIHTGVYAQPQKWIQAEAELEDQPTPYAKAFRERVCPVPEFPSVGTAPQEAQADPKKDVCPNCGEVANGCNYCRKTPAPVPQTEGEEA